MVGYSRWRLRAEGRASARRPAPLDEAALGYRAIERERPARRCAEIEERDDVVRFGEPERCLDARVVGGGAGAPESAIAERVGGDHQVLGGRTRGDDLLDRRDLVFGEQLGRGDEDEGGAER